MSDHSDIITRKLTSMTEKKPDKRERISGRLRHALDLMIWGDENGKPLDWNDAARSVKISARSMRKSLERPAVRKYLSDQKVVLRACIGAKSLSRLDEIAAQRSNMNAAVNAIREIEGAEAETAAASGRVALPGLVVQIRADFVERPSPRVIPDRSIPPPLDGHAFGVQPAPQAVTFKREP